MLQKLVCAEPDACGGAKIAVRLERESGRSSISAPRSASLFHSQAHTAGLDEGLSRVSTDFSVQGSSYPTVSRQVSPSDVFSVWVISQCMFIRANNGVERRKSRQTIKSSRRTPRQLSTPLRGRYCFGIMKSFSPEPVTSHQSHVDSHLSKGR